jgi:hypothetical protein
MEKTINLPQVTDKLSHKVVSRLRVHRCQPLRFFRNFYEFQAKVTVLRSTVLVTDFRLLPARNRSPFKYHCDHLDASLSVKIA